MAEMTKAPEPKKKMYKIIIPASKEHPEDVTGGVNGVAFRIQRGKEVVVGEHIVEVLRNAKIPHYKNPEALDTSEVVSEMPRFPFSAILVG